MRLQMRYESAEMGMDDEHWSLNIMSKLAKHKPAEKRDWEKAVSGLWIYRNITMSVIRVEYFWQKLPPVLVLFDVFFGSSVLMLNWECMVFHLRSKMISRNDLTVSTDFGEFLSSTWFSAGQICWFEVFNYFLRFVSFQSKSEFHHNWRDTVISV